MEGPTLPNVPELIHHIFSDRALLRGLKARGASTRLPLDSFFHKVMKAVTKEVPPGSKRVERGMHMKRPMNGLKAWSGWNSTKADKNHESVLCNIFNGIVENVSKHLKISKPARIFSSQISNESGKDKKGKQARKPDVVVLEADGKKRVPDWPQFVGAFQTNDDLNSMSEAYMQVDQNARMIVKNQPGRRFVSSVAIVKKTVLFTVHDRSGELSAEVFHVDKVPEKLVRIILGFAFCEEVDLGYDPSYVKKGKDTFITIYNTKYRIVRPLSHDGSIWGRGTLINLLTPVGDKDGKEFLVLKDVWVDRSRPSKEWDLLEKMKKAKIKGVVKMKHHEEVYIDGKLDTTESVRNVLEEQVEQLDENGEEILDQRWKSKEEWLHFEKLEVRDHHRVLLKTFGKPIEDFRSLKELISAFRDYFKTIGELDDNDILHQDISLKNLILVDEEDFDDEETPLNDCDTGDSEVSGVSDGDGSCIHGDTSVGDDKPSDFVEAGSDIERQLGSQDVDEKVDPPVVKERIGLRRGIIIDFDCAVHKIEHREEIARARRTGTLPYMAIDVLKQNLADNPGFYLPEDRVMHAVCHDIESAFYVLCWLCISQAGPNSKDRRSTEPFDYVESPIGKWAAASQDKVDYELLADKKSGMVVDEKAFEARVLCAFHPYFEKLKPYIERLRELICPPGRMSKTQNYRIEAGKVPRWITDDCIERPKTEVFEWIDRVLADAMNDDNTPALASTSSDGRRKTNSMQRRR